MSTVSFLGKIPVHGDFVRHNAGTVGMRSLDEWVQKGLYFAKMPRYKVADTDYASAPPYRFSFTAEQGSPPLIGVIGPSRDRVGRKFPFLVAFEEDGMQPPGMMAPIYYDDFYRQAEAMVQEAAGGEIEYATLAARSSRLDPMGRDGVSYGHFLDQTPLKTMWERIWGYADDSRKYMFFKNLLDILLPLRSGLPAGFPLVLRFPLGTDARISAFDAGFWLEVCQRLLQDPSIQPTYFWSAPEQDNQTPYLFVALRRPPAEMFAHLLSTTSDTDNVCKLEEMGTLSAAQAALSIPARYGGMLENDTMSLRAFLQQL